MHIYQKPNSIIPHNDSARLKKLYSYGILDTHSEETFDNIAKLAAQIFGTSSAFISFVDEKRVFFKSNLSNLQGNEVPRDESLCSLAILDEDKPTVFTDTHQNPDLLDNPNVSCEGGIRFYAGAPLKTAEGYQLGTVCVTDSEPRQATEHQLQMLRTLSSLIINELEQRLATRRAIQAQTDLMHMTVHDLKNPANNLTLLAEMLTRHSADTELVKELAEKVKLCSGDIHSRLNGLLHLYQIENGDLQLNLQLFNLADLIDYVVHHFELQAKQKQQTIQLDYAPLLQAYADRARIQEVLENLLSNAIKYSYPGSTITISASVDVSSVVIAIKDQGQGLSLKDMEKLFRKFAKLSAVPTGKEGSNKLGLSIVKALVELHNGKVWAISEGKNKGATFYVSLPLHQPVL